MNSMRKEWFNFVAVTRKKMQRKTKDPVTHRGAMKEASIVWPKEKAKILNRRKREDRRNQKAKLVESTKKVQSVPGGAADKTQ